MIPLRFEADFKPYKIGTCRANHCGQKSGIINRDGICRKCNALGPEYDFEAKRYRNDGGRKNKPNHGWRSFRMPGPAAVLPDRR